jgi:hypothetical protein
MFNASLHIRSNSSKKFSWATSKLDQFIIVQHVAINTHRNGSATQHISLMDHGPTEQGYATSVNDRMPDDPVFKWSFSGHFLGPVYKCLGHFVNIRIPDQFVRFSNFHKPRLFLHNFL